MPAPIENIKKAIMYMHPYEPIYSFIKNAVVIYENDLYEDVLTTTDYFKVIVPANIFRRTVNLHNTFIGIIKQLLHDNFGYSSVIITLNADWDKLQLTSTEVVPIETPWEQINALQRELLESVKAASTLLDFRNIGNSCRTILELLADTVYDEGKHKTAVAGHKTSKDKFKNRLWAFMKYKFANISTHEKIEQFAESILDSSDNAIDLSNDTTHSFSANNFLAQSCVISAITVVHLVKSAFEIADP